MKYDLTEKLKFSEDPVLGIRNTELTVRSDAETVLTLLDAISNKSDAEGARAAAELLLSEKDREKLAALRLKIDDYITVMKTMVQLAIGADPEEEAPAGE